MDRFQSDGVEIAFIDEPAVGAVSGPPVLLIHGFASNVATNWIDTKWVARLTGAGRRVVALDNRGHGKSQKLHDPEAYPARTMAGDAVRLLDHLGIAQADVMGYSMGARISCYLALDYPDRVRRLVFAGLGIHMITGMSNSDAIADALLAPSADDVPQPGARAFRIFAEQTRSDLLALAACIRSSRAPITAQMVAGLTCPVLVAVGSLDDVGGPPEPLAALIPGAEAFVIPDRDHMKSVGDRALKDKVVAFFGAVAPQA